MRWSKLKSQTEAMFAPAVQGRVELHTTRYAKSHDRFGRSWITIDGVEIANMSNYLAVGSDVADGNPARFAEDVFAGYDLPEAMREYLALSPARALASPNPLSRSLAVLDRRTGKKRLATIILRETSALVIALARFRAKQESPVCEPAVVGGMHLD